MSKYLITSIKTCPECKGLKMVYHPLWAAYWKAQDGGRLKDYDDLAAWFQEEFANHPTKKSHAMYATAQGRSNQKPRSEKR